MQDKSESLTGRAVQIHIVLLYETQTTGDNSSLFLRWPTDSTSWPCESHLNIFNQKKTEKRKRERERKEEGKTSDLLIADIFSTLIFYAHLITLLTALEVK